MKRRSGFQVMARLIGLVKPLTGFMLLAILMGLIGHLCAAFITIFGGYAVLKYMHEHGSPFDSVVLRCPAVNLHEIFTGLYLTENDLDKLRRGRDAIVGFEKKFKINRQFLDSLAENDIMRYDFSAFADSMLIMHGTRDETVPIDAVRRFAEKNDLMLIEINGADHMFKDPARMSEYVNNTVDFIFG